MSAIPLVDMAAWFEGDAAPRQRLADDVDAHLRRLGFLVVVNHGIDPDIISTCRSEVTAFFHLPPEVKAEVAQLLSSESPAYRGWVGSGLESNAATYGIDTPPDLRESFTCGPVDVADLTLRSSAPRWFAPNRWPADPPGFRPAAEAWWRAARVLADELLDLFALALGIPATYFRERCGDTTADATFNWYGPLGDTVPEPGQFRVGPHTDFGTLTILDRQPGVGGLQVLDEHGRWIDAPHVDGALLVNTGDLLRRWTNDRWESNEHRVLPPPPEAAAEEMLSLVFFHEPDHEALIEVLDTCVSPGNPARYGPITADAYLSEKMDALVVPQEPGGAGSAVRAPG